MTRRVSAREIVGKTIVAIDHHLFADGKGGRAGCPEITLSDGSVLYFVVEETEIGDYGVWIGRNKL